MSKRQGGKVKPLKQAKKENDKTFGMKNKKGKAAQKVVSTYNTAGKSKEEKLKDQEREQRKAAKAEKERLENERTLLFKAVEQKRPKQKVQTVPPGVDPKSVLCINFKAGHCEKGDTCIFSHDLNVERKGEKRDMYSDARDNIETDTIDNWDDKKLAEVIAKKAVGKPGNPTAGICKHFIKALEDRKFGWFWECPQGEKCQYRHALPPGFKLQEKKKKKKKKLKKDQ